MKMRRVDEFTSTNPKRKGKGRRQLNGG